MPKRAVPAARRARAAVAKVEGTPAGAGPARGNDRTPAAPKPSTGRRRAAAAREVLIRSESGVSMTVPLGSDLKQAAMEWSRVVEHRARWATQPDARAAQAERSRAALVSLGLPRKEIDNLADSSVVQVTVPFENEETGWEARVFPWEYVLSAALRGSRIQPFLVLRHLNRTAAAVGRRTPKTVSSAPPQKALILESAPGDLRNRYSFDSERQLVATKLRPVEVDYLPDASPDQAREYIAQASPEAIHLAGFDAHQGNALLGLSDSGLDGYLMVDQRGHPLAVSAEALADILAAGASKVRLVACNFQNSGARIAALAVAAGAQSALGFQDRVDDAVAEAFYSQFYEEWRERGWDACAAFEHTFAGLVRANPEVLRGTGIILWTDYDVLPGVLARRAAEAARPMAVPVSSVAPPAAPAAGGPTPDAGGLQLMTQSAVDRPVPGIATVVPSGGDIIVRASVIRRVNYSLLHNDRALFETFTIHNATSRVVDGIQVEVTLFAGSDSFPYRRLIRLDGPVLELKDKIRVPLTSALLRGLRETIQSVVYISVKHGQQSLYEDTVPVSLVPVDEWSNAEQDAAWLPSFVLPRDDAIDQIRRTAQALLRALRDRPGAGFDGYQSINQERNDPYEDVDLQVQALWSTLSFQYDLAYINPPPTYSPRAQRLRSPSTILGAKAGTCIDLVLLFASCLEYVEIYPVIVLYDGHASVGYWRDQQFHSDFQAVKLDERQPASDVEPSSVVVGASATGGGTPTPGTSTGSAAGTTAPTGGDGGPPGAPGGAPPESRSAAGAPPPGGLSAIASAEQGLGQLRGGLATDIPWVLRRLSKTGDPILHELKERVGRGELVLLEATLMTNHGGFREAQDLGEEGLDRRYFQALVDITIARRNDVLPLPMESR